MKKRLMVLGALATAGIVATSSLTSCSDDKPQTTPVDSTKGGTSTPVVSSGVQTTPTSTPVVSSSTSIADPVITSIVVTGHTTVFGIGDEISKGDNAKVTAYYSDNTTKDVTSIAQFNFENVDKTKVGTYSVSVSAAGQTTSYNVEVKDYILNSIEVEASDDAKTFYLYSSIDFSDIKINGIYKHPTKDSTTKKELNKSDVTFTVKDSDGNVVQNQFVKYGTYSVLVSYGDKNTSFEVSCVTSIVNSLADAVSSGVKAESTINGGSISYEFKDTGYNSSDTTDVDFSTSNSSSYTYGNDFVIVDKSGVKTYFSRIDDSTPFAVTVSGTSVSLGSNSDFLATVEDSKLIGINFFDNGSNTNGVASIVNELYNIYVNSSAVGQKKEEKGVCEHLDNKEGYKFSFTYLTSKYGAYVFNRYNVEFIINESGAIEKSYILVENFESVDNPNYGESSTEVPSDLPVEIKSEEIDGITHKYFIVKEGAKTSGEYIWKFTQTSGAKETENPYAASKIAISSFKVNVGSGDSKEEMTDGKVIELDLDNGNSQKDDMSHRFIIEYEMSDIPQSANSSLDKITISVCGTGKDGHVVVDDDYSYIFASTYDGYKVYINKPGTYQVTFKSLLVTKTITYNVDYEAPFSIVGKVHNGEKDSTFVSKEEFDMYVSNTIYVCADILDGFDPNYTIECSSDKVTLESVIYNDVNCYKVTASEAGSYELIVKGAQSADPNRAQATTKITLNVSADPSISDIIGEGKFEAIVSSELTYSVEFDGSTNSVKISNKDDNTKYQTYDYTYENKVFDLGFVADGNLDVDFTIEVGAYYDLYLNDGTKSYKLSVPKAPEAPIDAASILNGKYTVTTNYMNTEQVFEYEFTPTSEGAVSGTFTCKTLGSNGSKREGVYSYSYDASSKSFTYSKTSGKSVINDDAIVIKSTGLVYILAEVEYDFIRPSDLPEIDITDYLGTWDDGSGFTITLYEDYFTTSDGGRYTISSISYNNDNQVVVDGDNGSFVLTFISKDEMIDNYDYSYTKKTESLEMSSDMIGTWIDENGTTFVITSNGVTVKDSFGGDEYLYSLQSITDGKYKVVDATDPSYYYEIYFDNSVLYANDQYNNVCELTKQGESNDEIYDDFIGNWVDSTNNINITITKDSILWNNVSASNIKCELSDGTYYLSFDVNGTSYEGGFIIGGKFSIRTGTNQWYSFEKGNTSSSVDITEYLGKWVNPDDSELYIELSSTSFTNGEDIYTISSITTIDGKIVIVGNTGRVEETLTIDGNTMVETHPVFGDTTYEKESGSNTIDITEYLGKWVNPDDSELYIELSSTSFTNGYDEYTITSITSEDGKITIEGVCGTITDILVLDGNTLIEKYPGYNDTTYEKDSSSDSGSNTVEIPENFRGQWEDSENAVQLTISADSIVWNDITATGIAYEGGYISFNVSGYNETFVGFFKVII